MKLAARRERETDTGVEYTHPDLAANIWTNPGGIGGCPAGTHGFNVLSGTCDPMDDDAFYGGHGTHVAGIMGAVSNNGLGVAGTNWQTSILPVKSGLSSIAPKAQGLRIDSDSPQSVLPFTVAKLNQGYFKG